MTTRNFCTHVAQESITNAQKCNLLKALPIIVICDQLKPTRRAESETTTATGKPAASCKTGNPMKACKFISSMLFQLSPYFLKPFKFVISWKIFFYSWCDEQVNVLPSCTGCHLVMRTMFSSDTFSIFQIKCDSLEI